MLFHHPFLAAADRHPDKTALVCGGERVGYGDLATRVLRLAGALRAAAVAPGDRVAVCLPNSVPVVVTVLAALHAGAAFVVINPGVKSAKLAHILADSGARVLVTDPAVAGAVVANATVAGDAADGTPAVPTVFVTGDVPAEHGGRMRSWSEALAGHPATAEGYAGGGDALCYLLYTSGSTGGGKGVMMSHGSASFAADAITAYLHLTPADVVLNFSPLAADYGLYNVLMPLRAGATAVLEQGYVFPKQILGAVARERVTGLALVPTIVAMFLQTPGIEARDLAGVRFLTSTGQALPRAHIAKLRALLPQCDIYSMYGLTECKRVSVLDPAEIDARPDSVGKPMAGTEAWLADDAGHRLPPPQEPGQRITGELVVRGPHVMQGYWNLPAETAACLRPGPTPDERVLFTGDLFEIDAAGYLYFVARKDDLIKSSGERISPREIEDCIFALEGVTAVVVHAVPDEILGHAIHATVAIATGAAIDAARVRAHCAEHLERALVPRQVEICARIPLTLTGKVRRRRE